MLVAIQMVSSLHEAFSLIFFLHLQLPKVLLLRTAVVLFVNYIAVVGE